MSHRPFASLALVALCTLLLSGCLYTHQRTHDFLDIIQLGAGVTAESEFSWIPPTFGVLAEVGPVALGGITHNGYTAEIDGRGLFAGRESRNRLAGLYIQGWEHWQDYENGCTNYYRDENRSRAWQERMMEMAYTKRLFWEGTVVPAKVTLHEDQDWTWEVLPLLRGWQYWETIGVQAGISDPFITHAGLYLHVGVDPSEVVDFLLGLFTIDLKGDDIPIEELEI